MNYSQINTTDIANGEGVRVSLFVSGCRWNCPGCFNKEAQDFNYGQEFTYKEIDKIWKALANNYISGITLLGGEPLEPENRDALAEFALNTKTLYPNKTIWCYTGDVWENVKNYEIMRHIDVLVDGPFIEDLKDLTLKFRGSSNQRVIDVQKSLQSDKVVLYLD